MEVTKFKKNVQNIKYKPDTCLNSGEYGVAGTRFINGGRNIFGKNRKKASSCVCWTNRLGQVSKYHLEIEKMQKLTMNSKTFVAVAL